MAAWTEYRFTADGQVQRRGGAGSRAETPGDTNPGTGTGGSVVTNSVAPNRRGRYRIAGLALHIDYDDGSREQRILIADPKGLLGAIWLDGHGYVQRGERAGAK